MLTAQTRISTDRAIRYLHQLCQHLDHLAHRRGHGGTGGVGHGPGVQSVEWTDTLGTIAFAFGRCELAADDLSLTIRLSAEDVEALRHLQAMFSARLDTIGRRDGLVVAW